MGISDDIVHRRKHKTMLEPTPVVKHEIFDIHEHAPAHHPSQKLKEEEEDDEEKGEGENKGTTEKSHREILSDSFFSPKNGPEPAGEDGDKTDIAPGSKKKIAGILFIFLFLLLGSILVIQNFSDIKAAVSGKSDKEATGSTASNNSYEGEVPSQDNTAAPSASTGTAATSDVTTAATPAATAPAATTPAVNNADLKIQIRNGNGISGSAQSVKKTLTDAGFTVSSVTNATSFSYATSIVYYKTGKEEGANLVKASLPALESKTEKSDSIAANYDIVVLVGKK